MVLAAVAAPVHRQGQGWGIDQRYLGELERAIDKTVPEMRTMTRFLWRLWPHEHRVMRVFIPEVWGDGKQRCLRCGR